MNAPVIAKRFHHLNPIADLNRQALRDANVRVISVVGGPGCGKTTLIDAAIDRLKPGVHAGVIACDLTSKLDSERITQHSDQVVQVNVGPEGILDAGYIRDALEWLDLSKIDVLFIENIGTLVGPPLDLGQDATTVVFSVAAGHDKPSKHPDVVRAADAVVLNKIDLINVVPFELELFRAGVRAINLTTSLFELSALSGAGLKPWLDWVESTSIMSHSGNGHARESHWFG